MAHEHPDYGNAMKWAIVEDEKSHPGGNWMLSPISSIRNFIYKRNAKQQLKESGIKRLY